MGDKNKEKRAMEVDSSTSSDVDSDDGAFSKNMIKIKLNKRKVIVLMDSLEKENKSLKQENESLKAELEILKHENDVLRDANVKFQVEVHDLKAEKPQIAINGTNTHTIEEFYVTDTDKTLEPIKKTQLEITSVRSSHELNELEEIGEDSQEVYYETLDESEMKLILGDSTTQEGIQKKYKIHLDSYKIESLNELEAGDKADSKFLNLLLPWIYDKKTLVNSTVTGKTYTKKGGGISSHSRLDPKKMSFIKEMFIHRINNESCSQNDKESRIRKFQALVGNKISNLKLSNKRKSQSKGGN